MVTDVILPAYLNQGEGPLDIGLDEWGWGNQGVIVVTLGGVVDHSISLTDQLVDQVSVTDITNNQLNLVLRQTSDVS